MIKNIMTRGIVALNGFGFQFMQYEELRTNFFFLAVEFGGLVFGGLFFW